jgi:hypothetical protein
LSTILDALKKLQREKAAQSPSRDLRGSVATETSWPRPRRRRGIGGALVWVALLALVAGGGWWAYASGSVGSLVARLGSASADGDATGGASEAELEALERELRAAEERVVEPPVATPPVVAPPAAPAQETPEMTAERARLEAVIAQAREAQESQQRAEAAAAASRIAAEAAPPPPVPAPVEPAPPEPAPRAAPAPPVEETPPPAPVAKPAPTSRPKAAAKPKAEPKPKAAAAKSAPAPKPKPAPEQPSTPSAVAFPTVSVERIRWHPIPERRVASLRFEQQNAPEAHEGDIVAGVLVYRIDPGAVELRIGDAQRIVRPGS